MIPRDFPNHFSYLLHPSCLIFLGKWDSKIVAKLFFIPFELIIFAEKVDFFNQFLFYKTLGNAYDYIYIYVVSMEKISFLKIFVVGIFFN